jgi:hypothetical protein
MPIEGKCRICIYRNTKMEITTKDLTDIDLANEERGLK